jgi:hypothetical protein
MKVLKVEEKELAERVLGREVATVLTGRMVATMMAELRALRTGEDETRDDLDALEMMEILVGGGPL